MRQKDGKFKVLLGNLLRAYPKINIKELGSWGYGSAESAYLACRKPWFYCHAPYKLDMVVHTYDPGTQEVGGSEVQTEKKKL